MKPFSLLLPEINENQKKMLLRAILEIIGEDYTYGSEAGMVKGADNEKRRLRKAFTDWIET